MHQTLSSWIGSITILEQSLAQFRINIMHSTNVRGEISVKQPIRRVRNLADYSYPSTDIAALSEKALEITRRLTEHYGEVPFSSKDPMSMLVDILLSHRTRD